MDFLIFNYLIIRNSAYLYSIMKELKKKKKELNISRRHHLELQWSSLGRKLLFFSERFYIKKEHPTKHFNIKVYGITRFVIYKVISSQYRIITNIILKYHNLHTHRLSIKIFCSKRYNFSFVNKYWLIS